MRTFVCDPQTEIIGQGLSAILENLQIDEIRPHLEKHDLVEVLDNHWYSAQKFLDVLNDIFSSRSGTSNLVAVGMAIPTKMLLPPELANATLPMILEMWNDIYYLQHRGSDIGYVKTEKVTDTHYRVTHNHLYPDDIIYGIGYGMARRFLPKGTHFHVQYDPTLTRKDEGGAETVLEISWD